MMVHGSPHELFLGLVAESEHWQSMCGAASSAEARNYIKGFGAKGDAAIEAGWAVAFSKVDEDRMRLTGAPSSYTASGIIRLDIEIPYGGPAETYGAVMAAARDLEDGHMAAWEDVRTVRREILAAGNQPGTFCPGDVVIEDISRGHWTRKNDRWRFRCSVSWGPTE